MLEIAARPGSTIRVRVVGPRSSAEARIAAAHKIAFAMMYWRFIDSLTAGASAAAEEPKAMSESAARAG
jgi:hypothetical protein